MSHLMIFSIGPVQDFIATARRSRDLWYGSWMLSELSKVAANKIVELTSFDNLIFPHPTNEKLLEPTSDFNAPNKIVAVVETDNPKQFAKDIKDATVNYLVEKLAQPTMDAIQSKTFNRTLADAQIKDLPELYWVSVPYNDRKYEVVREEAEALLIARKNTRDFNQITGENRNVPKSSLDGARESVIDEDEYPDRKNSDPVKARKIRKLYDNYHARQGERLSGVDLLKRLGARNDEPDFKSTSHMAAIPFLEKLVKVKGPGKDKKLLAEIRGVLPEDFKDIDRTNEVLVFESRLTDWVYDKTQLADLRKKVKDILDKEEYTGGKFSPNPYYALLRADGDNMGKVIDGQTEKRQHQELSEALSKFAREVKSIVNEQHNGLLIYSGGDDVLAYLPINQALSCAVALEKKFKNAFREDSTNEESPIKIFAEDKTTSPTLSIGIVVAHHLDPLSDVLELARSAEKKAKQIEGKNGLAITLSKRSGTDRTIVGKFGDLHKRLNDMIDLTDKKIISGGTAYELQELGHTLPDDFPLEGLKVEALRIVKHKQAAGGEKLTDEDKGKYLKTVEGWLTNLNLNKEDKKYYSLQNLAYEMIIAKELVEEV